MSATTSDRHSNPMAHRVRRQRLLPSLLIEKRPRGTVLSQQPALFPTCPDHA
jgi:hypothetical protein